MNARTRVSTILAALLLGASLTPASAVPGVVGGALASDNVDYIATVPDVGAVGGRLVGSTMFVTTAKGLRIYDVSLGIPVPKGTLELPHFFNEDVDTNGRILLIAADHSVGFPKMLYVINVENQNLPVLTGVLSFPSAAHTITCINGCSYGWIGGGSLIYVVDLRTPSAPKIAGSFDPPGSTHDVNVDAAGIAWVSSGFGAGGLFGYDTTDPVNPSLVAGVQNGAPGAFNDNFILHNSQRPDATAVGGAVFSDDKVDTGEVVLVTEEDWLGPQNDSCRNDGQFQTGWYHEVAGKKVVERLDGFNLGGGTTDTLASQKPGATMATCSAHYFDYRAGVAAVAWYEQGVRFIDVSNPRDIKQIGYFMPLAGEALATTFNGEYLYTFDTARGIDVLRFTGSAGDAPQLAPRLNVPEVQLSAPDPRWGYACRIPLI